MATSCSVARSCPTLWDSMDCSMPSFPVLHYLQFARNSCSLSQWSHPTNASSVAPFSCLQSLPASASASVLPMNIQGWFPLGWTALISLLSKGLSRVLSQHRSSKASSFQCSAFFIVQLWHPYMTTGKTIALTRWAFVGKGMSLLFNMLSRFVIAFLPRSKHLLISRLQLPFAVIFGAQENKICLCFHLFPHIFAMNWWDQMPWS